MKSRKGSGPPPGFLTECSRRALVGESEALAKALEKWISVIGEVTTQYAISRQDGPVGSASACTAALVWVAAFPSLAQETSGLFAKMIELGLAGASVEEVAELRDQALAMLTILSSRSLLSLAYFTGEAFPEALIAHMAREVQ